MVTPICRPKVPISSAIDLSSHLACGASRQRAGTFGIYDQPKRPLKLERQRPSLPFMKKRAVATVLWLYAGWFAGAFAAFMFGVSPALGPIIGFAAAALVATDPRHVIWTTPAPKASRVPVQTAPNPA
jgi:hypothetical protein